MTGKFVHSLLDMVLIVIQGSGWALNSHSQFPEHFGVEITQASSVRLSTLYIMFTVLFRPPIYLSYHDKKLKFVNQRNTENSIFWVRSITQARMLSQTSPSSPSRFPFRALLGTHS
ncbi:hypothetical protein BKA64DRAFT_149432 [Cadophora sp. MPI-SDFR-AT-0126]|nr:hypothetical protein BKA64DRAFT_149432 [Leotiomycetes sp. MPI-SDFR-AT-0126]